MARKRTKKRRTAEDDETDQGSDGQARSEEQADPGKARDETGQGATSARSARSDAVGESAGASDAAKDSSQQKAATDGAGADPSAPTARTGKRRRRGRRKPRPPASTPDEGTEATEAPAEASDASQAEKPTEQEATEGDPPPSRAKKRKPRRGRAGKKAKKDASQAGAADTKGKPSEASAGEPPPEPVEQADEGALTPEGEEKDPAKKTKRRRSRRRGKDAPKSAPVSKIGRGREMLINVMPNEECRVAMTLDGKLEELFIERVSAESHVGNIYKGRVTNVEPSIQAAFVDFGLSKNGFLHISDLVPQYFPGYDGESEDIGRKTPHRERPPIQKCLRRGQEVIVQITKEGIGTKGPTLNTYISLPGRFLVMMPGMGRLGVSRKIEDDEDRQKMREMLNQLSFPKGMGFILRTAGLNRTKREIQRDLNYLIRLWKTVSDKIKNEPAPTTLYQESDLAIRTVRDTLEADVERIVVDDEETAQKVRDFLTIAMPRAAEKVLVYDDAVPLFYRYKIEEEIEKLHSRHVPLASGGSLVIDSTEALVAIDVNSGKYRDHDNAEETALRTNLEAAEEIARQLRLRDLGGVVVCDFIDMRHDKNRRQVEKALREAVKRHKERAKMLRMSRFGMIEMTRQRTRPSISRSMHRDCPMCRGTGMVKTPESASLEAMRMLQLASHRQSIDQVEIQVCPEVAFELQNRRRQAIHELEMKTGKRIVVRAVDGLAPEQLDFSCHDSRGRTVKFP